MNLEGKTAIVTGSSRGIGSEIAKKLASMGANIVLNSSPSSEVIQKTYDEFKNAGYNVVMAKCDISRAEDVEEMIKTAIDTFGSIDILVNNAGVTKDNLLVRMTEEDWDKVINTNLKSVFLCTKAVAKIMMKQRRGKIINITSVVGVMGNAGQVNYAASKAGIIGLTKSVAKELAPRGITCNAIAPGFIESDMTKILSKEVKEVYMSNIPLKRFGTPFEVAELAAYLASDGADYITGQVIHVDGGLVM